LRMSGEGQCEQRQQQGQGGGEDFHCGVSWLMDKAVIGGLRALSQTLAHEASEMPIALFN
jgi:hypothetical protein